MRIDIDINRSVIIDDPDLDAQIAAADEAAYAARKAHAALIEQKMNRLLRAVLPAGGTLHLSTWAEAGDTGLTIEQITLDGVPYENPEDEGDTDPAAVMGGDSYEQLIECINTLTYAGVGAIHWKYGRAEYNF